MQNTNERREMVCGQVEGGLLCIDGVREDFKHQDKAGNKIKCRQWCHLYGKDPQSEKIIDQFDCAHSWGPVLATEGAQMTRQATASIDAMRSLFAGLVRRAPEEQVEGPPPAAPLEHKENSNGAH